MHIRHPEPKDFDQITAVINEWWGGRIMSDMLPRLFFVHFRDTSFVAENQGRIIGFLVGFLSQTYPDEAYVHFLGVHPSFRKQGVGWALYSRFFDAVEQRGRNVVRLVTSPVNKQSIAFHTHIGFKIDPQDVKVDGTPIYRDYDGQGHDRVLFVKRLSD